MTLDADCMSVFHGRYLYAFCVCSCGQVSGKRRVYRDNELCAHVPCGLCVYLRVCAWTVISAHILHGMCVRETDTEMAMGLLNLNGSQVHFSAELPKEARAGAVGNHIPVSADYSL